MSQPLIRVSETRVFRASTVRVHSVNAVEASVDLDFGVTVRKVFIFAGVRVADIPQRLRKEALHCLVVLLGGKRLLVQPAEAEREQWGRRPEVHARVFLDARICGTPIGLTTGLPGLTGAFLEVTPFLRHLQEHEFDLQFVKNALRGPR